MHPPRRALLVFLDGVGIGKGDPRINPFAAAPLQRIRALLDGARPVHDELANGAIVSSRAILATADATLGVPGLPQSGTGQTALLTGRNAAAMFGRHFGSWVPTSLRPMLAEHNLLSQARARGWVVAFANAYPTIAADADPRIFRRPAAPPLAARAAGALVRDFRELAAGTALASSITNEHWRARLGDDIADVTPEAAGRTLAQISASAVVTLFAHYDTDYVGHRGDLADAVAAVEKVDAFLGSLADALAEDTLLVVASDHGNLEDVSGGHTRNAVPVLAIGPGRAALAERVRDLTDVSPALLEILRPDERAE